MYAESENNRIKRIENLCLALRVTATKAAYRLEREQSLEKLLCLWLTMKMPYASELGVTVAKYARAIGVSMGYFDFRHPFDESMSILHWQCSCGS